MNEDIIYKPTMNNANIEGFSNTSINTSSRIVSVFEASFFSILTNVAENICPIATNSATIEIAKI
jgi:hypothetical protein